MPHPHLRVYWPEDDDTFVRTERPAEQVTVPLAEVLPLLIDAARSRRAWLLDFENESITISADLHEVLHAYEHYRPTA